MVFESNEAIDLESAIALNRLPFVFRRRADATDKVPVELVAPVVTQSEVIGVYEEPDERTAVVAVNGDEFIGGCPSKLIPAAVAAIGEEGSGFGAQFALTDDEWPVDAELFGVIECMEAD
jgi:hypothetical protein